MKKEKSKTKSIQKSRSKTPDTPEVTTPGNKDAKVSDILKKIQGRSNKIVKKK